MTRTLSIHEMHYREDFAGNVLWCPSMRIAAGKLCMRNNGVKAGISKSNQLILAFYLKHSSDCALDRCVLVTKMVRENF